MTDRLYYTDPYLRAFDATVTRAERRGDRLAVTLDRTAFYPTSGGQPFDTGTLGSLHVVDVVDEEDGSVSHITELRTENVELRTGDVVHGDIDWTRRFDHMQQHTGQHVLSAAFDKLFAVRTVSFHLGAEVSTIDLAREMTPAEIASAEAEANRVIWEDRPVTIRFADEEEAKRLPLRKESTRAGVLRVIDVQDFDLSACGGTHVARTGGIGVIAIASWERFKGGQRLEFLCGGRALSGYRRLRDATKATVQKLSVLVEELPEAVERLQGEVKDQKRSIAALQNDLARYRAEELEVTAEQMSSHRFVTRAIDADANGLKSLATAITAKPGFFVVLTSTVTPSLVVVARSADVKIPSQQLVSELIAVYGGRGGGRPELAQAGGVSATAELISNFARLFQNRSALQ
jgi:alanyl-tRNA synthetase